MSSLLLFLVTGKSVKAVILCVYIFVIHDHWKGNCVEYSSENTFMKVQLCQHVLSKFLFSEFCWALKLASG